VTSYLPAAVALGSGLLSLLLTAVVLATSRARARAQVQQATAGLQTARDEFAARERYLIDVLDAVDAVVVTTDAEGRLVHRNLAARALGPSSGVLERTAEAAAQMRISGPDRREPLSRANQPTPRALAGEIIRECEIVVEARDGGPRRTLLANAQPLRDSTGALIGAVSSSYDITDRKHIEQQLVEAAAALHTELVKRQETEAELRAFAGIVAHDLKSPLTAVTGYAEVLCDSLEQPPTHSELARNSHAARRILHGANRMRGLIDDLLSYATARDRVLNPEPVDLQKLAAEVITERTDHLTGARHAAGLSQSPEICTGPLPTIHADAGMIRQLLDNLIGNALKYTVPGQAARISISAHTRPGDRDVRIEIADRGLGIPTCQRDRVFDSFHRVDTGKEYTGTGLGLAICKRIVDRHNGSISVTDNPGGGSRFQFTLSAVIPPPRSQPSPAPAYSEIQPVRGRLTTSPTLRSGVRPVSTAANPVGSRR
jgi:signal transduction histidine kinase